MPTETIPRPQLTRCPRAHDTPVEIAVAPTAITAHAAHPANDATVYGANAGYYRNLIAGLEASLAVSLDGVSREQLEDIWTASAQLGLRYSF